MKQPERCDIGRPIKGKEEYEDMQEEVELDEGPNNVSELRNTTPVKPPQPKEE